VGVWLHLHFCASPRPGVSEPLQSTVTAFGSIVEQLSASQKHIVDYHSRCKSLTVGGGAAAAAACCRRAAG
jgi:hypothetical protein